MAFTAIDPKNIFTEFCSYIDLISCSGEHSKLTLSRSLPQLTDIKRYYSNKHFKLANSMVDLGRGAIMMGRSEVKIGITTFLKKLGMRY